MSEIIQAVEGVRRPRERGLRSWAVAGAVLVVGTAAIGCGRGPGDGPAATSQAALEHEPGGVPQPEPPDVHLPDPIEPGDALGSLAGGGYVSPTGAFAYQVPLDVPVGRAGMQPALALAYASHGGNGPVGIGWSIAGATSSITRCPKTWAEDGRTDGLTYDAADKFCLDGMPLVYVGSGASFQEFRTRPDTQTRVRAYSTGPLGPSYFRVWRSDGHVQTYQHEADARMRYEDGQLVATQAVRAVWMLATTDDRAGNRIRYEYEAGDDALSKQLRPYRIWYTANANLGASERRWVEFQYEPRPDPGYRWVNGIKLNQNERLKRIEMWAPHQAAPAPSELVWSYELEYDQSPRTNRSRLTGIRMCGHEGTCTWMRRFQYATAPLSHDAVARFDFEGELMMMLVGDFNGDGRDDILREERTVLELPAGTKTEYRMFMERPQADVAGELPLATRTWPTSPVMLGLSKVVDIDSDGKDELIGFSRSECRQKIYRWNGADFVVVGGLPVQATGPAADDCRPAHGEPPDPTDIIWVDLDGDGRVDRLRQHDTAEQCVQQGTIEFCYGLDSWLFERNLDGIQFSAPVAFGKSYDPEFKVVNLTGDGRPEVVFSDHEIVSVDSSGQPIVTAGDPLVGPGSQFGDMNGDGLADLVYFEENDLRYRINTGNGFLALQTVTDPDVVDAWSSVTQFSEKERSLADVNGDGRADIVMVLHNVEHGEICYPDDPSDSCALYGAQSTYDLSHYYFMVATGDGGYEKVLWRKEVYGLHDKGLMQGDFDGDGIQDFLSLRGSAHFPAGASLFTMNANPSDVIIRVEDEGSDQAQILVTYRRSEPATWASSTAQFPLVVPRKSAQVVWAIEGLDRAGPQFVRFEDPRYDLQGYGFLGYRIVREYTPAIPREVTRVLDNSTRVGTRYPFAGLPLEETTVTAILPHDWRGALPCVPGVDEVCGWVGPATAQGRITRTFYDYDEIQPSSMTYRTVAAALPGTARDTSIGEAPITIAWAPSERIHLVWDTGQNEAPATIRRRTERAYDVHGNTTLARDVTVGGVVHEVATEYEYRLDDWLLSLVRQTVERSHQEGVAGVPRTTRYTYDARGLLAIVDREPSTPMHLRSERTVDAGGRLIRTQDVDMSGAEPPRYQYWAYDDLSGEGIFESASWNEHGQTTWTWMHPAYGFAIKTMDVNGFEIDTYADDLGRKLRVESENGAVTRLHRAEVTDWDGDITGIMVHSEGGDGAESWVTYDQHGWIVRREAENDGGSRTVDRTDYDIFGRAIRQYRRGRGQPGAGVTETTYDSLGRVTSVTAPDGTGVTYAHSMFRTEMVDLAGRRRWSETDLDGRVVRSAEVLDGNELVVNLGYTDFDRLAWTQDPQGNVTSTQYDALGQPTVQVDPDSGTTTMTYTAFGEPRSSTNALGLVRQLTRDDLGRVTHITETQPFPLPPAVTTFEWDLEPTGQGKIGRSTSADGVVKSTLFDALGRPWASSWQVGGATYEIETTYDAVGRIDSIAYPEVPGRPRFTISYEYDPATGETRAVVETSPGMPSRELWRVTERADDGSLAALMLGNGVEERVLRNATTGRLEAMEVAANGNTLYATTYEYEATSGMLERRVEQHAERTEAFAYDDLGRLLRWDVSVPASTMTHDYQYDDLGNLLRVTRTGLGAGVVADNRYGTLVNGALTQPHALTEHNGAAIAYDAIGRATDVLGKTIVYNASNLPRTITKDLPAPQPDEVTTFAYDADDVRVRKAGPAGQTTAIGGVYEERVAPDGKVTHVFFVPGLAGVTAQVTFTPASSGDPASEALAFLHRDSLGSVGFLTDAAGAEVPGSRRYYEPFGARSDLDGLPSGAPAPDVRFGFTGHEHDDDLGLINMKGRIYDPTLRRFLSPDPVVVDPGSAQAYNRYSYALNTPLRATDPTGYRTRICTGGPVSGNEVVLHCGDVPEPMDSRFGFDALYGQDPYPVEYDACRDGGMCQDYERIANYVKETTGITLDTSKIRNYTPSERPTPMSDLEAAGYMLDAIGASEVPVVSQCADLASAGLCAYQGDWLGAVGSGLAVVPLFGTALKGGLKYGDEISGNAGFFKVYDDVPSTARTGEAPRSDQLGQVTPAASPVDSTPAPSVRPPSPDGAAALERARANAEKSMIDPEWAKSRQNFEEFSADMEAAGWEATGFWQFGDEIHDVWVRRDKNGVITEKSHFNIGVEGLPWGHSVEPDTRSWGAAHSGGWSDSKP